MAAAAGLPRAELPQPQPRAGWHRGRWWESLLCSHPAWCPRGQLSGLAHLALACGEGLRLWSHLPWATAALQHPALLAAGRSVPPRTWVRRRAARDTHLPTYFFFFFFNLELQKRV